MTKLCLIKLNGYPESFSERIKLLSKQVEKIFLIRGDCEVSVNMDNVEVINLFPFRGRSLSPIKRPFFMYIYLIQTIIYILFLSKKGNVDLIHCLDYPVDSIATLPSKIIYNVPLIISLRGLEHLKSKHLFSVNTFLRLLTKISIKFSDYIIYKSGYQPEYVKETLNLSSFKYSVIPTGINLEILDPKNYNYNASINHVQEKLPIHKEFLIDKNIFVFIGRISKVKGVPLLKEFIQKIKDENTRFILIGPKQEDLDIDYWGNNSENAKILEPIPFEQVIHILNIADGTILLSETKTEGAPRVLQESLAMGTPIIASNVCGIKEEFSDIQGSILIDRNSFSEFKEAIDIIKNHDITVDRNKVKDRFDIEKNYKNYGDIYRNLTSKR